MFFVNCEQFSILGNIASATDSSIESVVSSGPGLVFITYPEVVLRLPGAPFWAIIFFMMLVVSLHMWVSSPIASVCVNKDYLLDFRNRQWILCGRGLRYRNRWQLAQSTEEVQETVCSCYYNRHISSLFTDDNWGKKKYLKFQEFDFVFWIDIEWLIILGRGVLVSNYGLLFSQWDVNAFPSVFSNNFHQLDIWWQ